MHDVQASSDAIATPPGWRLQGTKQRRLQRITLPLAPRPLREGDLPPGLLEEWRQLEAADAAASAASAGKQPAAAYPPPPDASMGGPLRLPGRAPLVVPAALPGPPAAGSSSRSTPDARAGRDPRTAAVPPLRQQPQQQPAAAVGQPGDTDTASDQELPPASSSGRDLVFPHRHSPGSRRWLTNTYGPDTLHACLEVYASFRRGLQLPGGCLLEMVPLDMEAALDQLVDEWEVTQRHRTDSWEQVGLAGGMGEAGGLRPPLTPCRHGQLQQRGRRTA